MKYLKYLGYWLSTVVSIYLVIWMANDVAARFGGGALTVFMSLVILSAYIIVMVGVAGYE